MSQLLHRFVVVGDLHAGGNSGNNFSPVVGADWRTDAPPSPVLSDDRMDMMRDRLTKEISDNQVDFVVLIGDVINGNSADVQSNIDFKNEYLDSLNRPIYAVYGNHDRLTNSEWQQVWGHGRDYKFDIGDYGFIILNSSNEQGARDICISQPFLQQALNDYKDKDGVFFFSHIPRFSGGFRGDPITSPENWGADSPQCTDIMDMLAKQKNLTCMVHGHFHEFNHISMEQNIPVVFTGHMANYGVPYYNLVYIEIYDNGHVYVFHDGFKGEKINGEWQYIEMNKTYFNLNTKYKKANLPTKTIYKNNLFVDRFNSF